MNPSKATAFTMRLFVAVGVAVMAIGLVLSGKEHGEDIIWLGMLILLCSPLLGILTTLIALVSEKDWLWAKVAIVLAVIISAEVAISILF